MSLHDDLLTRLQTTGPVRLVASLRDPRLRFSERDRLCVFLPDLHLLSQERRKAYPYGTNDLERLKAVLTELVALRAHAPGVAVYQVGDALDLWREEDDADKRGQAATRILADHPALAALLDSPQLGMRFLLGNHDIDLRRFAPWRANRRHRFPLEADPLGIPSGLALHGDIFDWIEDMPDALNALTVYLFRNKVADYDDGDALDLPTHPHGDYAQGIGGDHDLGPLHGVDVIPARHNVVHEHELLPRALRLVRRANSKPPTNFRFLVVGHTHRARIVVDETDGFFALVDVGAWIEKMKDGAGKVPNCQVTAIGADEVRIYQLG